MAKETLTIKTPQVFLPFIKASRYKGAYGGRGSGKSHFFAELLVEQCIMRKIHAACIRETQISLKESVKKLIEDKIQALGVGSLFSVMSNSIETPHGGRIIFIGMSNYTAESIKSLEGYDIAWVEEAQTLSAKSLMLLRPTLRKNDSEMWFSWNPKSAADPVDILLRNAPPPSSIVIEANFRDNPFLPKVLLEEMEYDRTRDIDKYNHIWLGQYLRLSSARVFKNWRVAVLDQPEGTVYRLGADWGSVDPTVLIRCTVQGNILYVDYEAYMVGCEIINLPDLFLSIPDSEKWPIVADSSRPETINYMRSHGFPKMFSSVKGAGSVADGIEFLKSYEIVVHPRCERTIDELSLYSYKVDRLTDQVMPVLEDKNNHCIDALRYACEGIRRTRLSDKAIKEFMDAPDFQAPGPHSWMW